MQKAEGEKKEQGRAQQCCAPTERFIAQKPLDAEEVLGRTSQLRNDRCNAAPRVVGAEDWGGAFGVGDAVDFD